MTKTPVTYRFGWATHAGMHRQVNEDRAHANGDSGIFLVVDGMGGHAAGERAAAIAVATIPKVIEAASDSGSLERRIRDAITEANNSIFHASQTEPDCQGMACVLTVAVADGDKFAVGHVGDSRLYLAWSGGLRKLTSDHSPVGEREERGEITEEQAMRDPRRNEVYRDVGTRPHEASDENFIDIRTFPFRSDAAFLLCTDGLSDLLTGAEINAIVQRFQDDPQITAEELVDAANHAGGTDNITVVFIAGPEFKGAESRVESEARIRHSVTRMRENPSLWSRVGHRLLWMAAGAALGVAGIIAAGRMLPVEALPPVISAIVTGASAAVTSNDPRSLGKAIESARPGDVIHVPKGDYTGPLHLRDGIDVISAAPGETLVHGDVKAQELRFVRFSGFAVDGNLLIDNSKVEFNEITVTSQQGCAVEFANNSAGVLRASDVTGDGRCAIRIEGESSPRIVSNRIKNGAVEVHPPAHPVLLNNLVERPG